MVKAGPGKVQSSPRGYGCTGLWGMKLTVKSTEQEETAHHRALPVLGATPNRVPLGQFKVRGETKRTGGYRYKE